MKASILIVDDEPITRGMLRMLLELYDYVIFEAENGLEALEQIGQNQPDVVILDVMMPEMDGLTTCKKLRANPITSTLPVIMLSGRTHYEAVEEGMQAGANIYLGKPMKSEKLLESIQSLLPLELETAVVAYP